MKATLITKLFYVFLVTGLVVFYSLNQKKYFYNNSSTSEASSNHVILKEMPLISLMTLDGKVFLTKDFKMNSNGYYVHIWGTWCGPCEGEFPGLLEYASRVENKNVKFYLVAVNDELIKVQKFLKRFPNISKNVTILIDTSNLLMDSFGTYKVPETFLFDKNGKTITQFVGPQEWNQEIFMTKIDSWLGI